MHITDALNMLKTDMRKEYRIPDIKGIFSSCGAFTAMLLLVEAFPPLKYILYSLLLGGVAYGLSIFLYIRADRSWERGERASSMP